MRRLRVKAMKISVFLLLFLVPMMLGLNLIEVAQAELVNSEVYFISAGGAGSPSPPTWGTYERLSFTSTDTRWGLVASNGDFDPNYIVVVFTDNFTGQYDWYFTKSADGGITWATPEIAVDPDFDVMYGEIHSAAITMDDNGIVHMSFARHKIWWPRDTAPTGIYYARYDGISWSAPIIIYENMSPGSLLVYTNDIIAGRNDIVHLTYGSDYPGNDNGDIWYSRSVDSGFTWTTPININDFGWMDVGYRPSLAADDFGNVYYAIGGDWYNSAWTGEMYFRRSQNDGLTWGSQQVIGKRVGGDRDPRLMCDNTGGVYAVWLGDTSLLFKYSLDFGLSWTPNSGGILLVANVPGMGTQYFAELDDHGYIHIIYLSSETGIAETYYMRIDTIGNIITPPQIITPEDGYNSQPTGLALAGDQIYVTTKEKVPTVDTVPPTTTKVLDGALGCNDWFISDVTVTLTAVDMQSGVKKTEFSFDEVAWTKYTAPFTLTTEGITTIFYNSTDNAGNVEVTKSQEIKIDKTAPTITITSPESKNYTLAESLTFDFDASDTISGIASVAALLGLDPATIYLDPQVSTAEVGETFSVDICIADVIDLFAWQIKLEWDPAILDFVDAIEGDFLSSTGPTIFPKFVNQEEGWLMMGCTLLFGPGVSGSGKLATVTFQSIAVGETILDMAGIDTYLLDSNLEEIPYEVINGYFTSVLPPEEHDIAVTSVTVSTSEATSGDPVTVTVVVENQGTRTETFDISAFYDSNVISTQSVVSLSMGAVETLIFTWDTTGVNLGSYVIKAEATVVPGEVETLDNTYINGAVMIRIPVYSGQTLDLSTFEMGKYVLTVAAADSACNQALESVTFWVATTLSGIVTDEYTKEPISGVTISIFETDESVVTDEYGRYSFLIRTSGVYTVEMTLPYGYLTHDDVTKFVEVITAVEVNFTMYQAAWSDATVPRTIGYWKNWDNHYTVEMMETFIVHVKSASGLFSNLTIDNVESYLKMGRRNMEQKGQAQLLASWLNVVSAQLGVDVLVDLNFVSGWESVIVDADGILTVVELLEQIDNLYLTNPDLTKEQWETIKNILDALNNGQLFVE